MITENDRVFMIAAVGWALFLLLFAIFLFKTFVIVMAIGFIIIV